MKSTADLRTATLGIVKDLHPEVLSGEQAAAVVRDLAVVEKAAATGRMFAAVRVATTDAWRGQGHLSAADWLAAQVGITVREAQAQLGTARKASRLPKTKQAMDDGDLSPTQAAAVTDAATADPAAEEDLLRSAATDTTASLKEKAAKAKAAATDSATRERRIHAERSLRMRTDAEGAFDLHLRGPAVDGVGLAAMLRPFEEAAFRTGRTEGIRDRYENRSYDAFQAMLVQLRHGVAAPTTASAAAAPATRGGSATQGGSDTEGGTQAGQQPGHALRPVGGHNTKVIVRIDHTALVRGHTIAGETCEVAGLGPISVQTARELMADAFLAAVVTKGRDVVTVAHLGRALNAHQRTAIEAMGLRCSNIACNHRIALQIDHRTPWAECHETKLDNQDPLCPACHHLKTHRGYQLDPGHGPRTFRPPIPNRHAGKPCDDPDRTRTGPAPPDPGDPAPVNPSVVTRTDGTPPPHVTQPQLC